LTWDIVENIKLEFKQKNEEIRLSVNKYYQFKTCYNRFTLEEIQKIQHTKHLDNASDEIKLIHEILREFAIEASIPMHHLIDLLLSKAARNYQSHRFMDDFVYDVMHHRLNENDLIKHIQDTASTKILIDEQELLILKNLTHANIEYKRAEYRK